MRHSRRTNYPEWDAKESPAGRRYGSKRKRRSVSAQDSGHHKHPLSELPPHRYITP